MGENWFVYLIGFTAQLFFSARTILQWFKSEKAKRVVSPSSYWVLSILGAYLLCLYGWLRSDFSIILGQFLSYYVYLWNLREKRILQRISVVSRAVLLMTPLVAVCFVFKDAGNFVNEFFRNKEIPFGLILFGSAGQIIFTLRFLYQWVYSLRRHESVLPAGFWVISLVGSSIIIAYGLYRHDPVLILGQSFGFVAYIRNLVLYFKHRKSIQHNNETIG